jgi:hypothetical protein
MRYNAGYAACGISGDATPSEVDIRLTRRINEASRILDLKLMDHVIIGTPAQAELPISASKKGASSDDALRTIVSYETFTRTFAR